MEKRLKQLVQLAEDGDENAASDIAKEFPAQFEKIFGIPMPKLVKMGHGGEATSVKTLSTRKKKVARPQGVRSAKKGFGKAYMT